MGICFGASMLTVLEFLEFGVIKLIHRLITGRQQNKVNRITVSPVYNEKK